MTVFIKSINDSLQKKHSNGDHFLKKVSVVIAFRKTISDSFGKKGSVTDSFWKKSSVKAFRSKVSAGFIGKNL